MKTTTTLLALALTTLAIGGICASAESQPENEPQQTIKPFTLFDKGDTPVLNRVHTLATEGKRPSKQDYEDLLAEYLPKQTKAQSAHQWCLVSTQGSNWGCPNQNTNESACIAMSHLLQAYEYYLDLLKPEDSKAGNGEDKQTANQPEPKKIKPYVDLEKICKDRVKQVFSEHIDMSALFRFHDLVVAGKVPGQRDFVYLVQEFQHRDADVRILYYASASTMGMPHSEWTKAATDRSETLRRVLEVYQYYMQAYQNSHSQGKQRSN